MARAVLLFLGMSSAGCIIPTPLEQQPAAVNHPPKILTDQLAPQFPSFTRAKGDSFAFDIVANDDDPGDTLTTRLFYAHDTTNSAPRIPWPSDITLTSASSNTMPGRRSGSFPQAVWCELFSPDATSNNVVAVWIAVTDRVFTSAGSDQTPDNDSDLDEVQWTLTCTD